MDRFTRNYTIFLAMIGVLLLVWLLYEGPQISDLNDLLEQDAEVTSYPYQFSVLGLQNGVATMSTPRSGDFPVYKALGILYPHLANCAQDNPDLVKAQQELARIQKYAQAIVMASTTVNSVRWELDKNWPAQHGVQTGP